MPTLAIIGAGAMGSGIGRRFAEHGARVLTLLEGRSEKSAARARAAGMVPASLEQIAAADAVLSIVPPAEAVAVGRRLAPVMRQGVFVDCNAINPTTMQAVADALAASGCAVLDGCLIGLPPAPGGGAPRLYISGDPDHRSAILDGLGVPLRQMEGPLGAASALKMVFAGINKGMTALGTAMLLAADRAGCAPEVRRELSESLPSVLARFSQAIPDMYPKAYRWVAEMQEIAEFLGPDDPASRMFEGAAEVFANVAGDVAGEGELTATLDRVLGEKPA
jgi:3-hydroxyisobutyrate dehydrogenase-like beta-hydroxyacid dehydrogenase